MSKRILEIDILKVIAIILMVVFHFVYDLNEFMDINVSYSSGFFNYVGKVSGLLFIFVSGINSGISKKPVKRGLMVLSFGMIISLVTFIVFKDEYIKFGILHLLGICMMLSPLLKRINIWVLLMLSLLIIGLDYFNLFSNINLIAFLDNLLGTATLDYYPLIPYISFFIIGIIVYKGFYYRKKKVFNSNKDYKIITLLSKNSLLIYLFHQPVILAILFLIKFIN